MMNTKWNENVVTLSDRDYCALFFFRNFCLSAGHHLNSFSLGFIHTDKLGYKSAIVNKRGFHELSTT